MHPRAHLNTELRHIYVCAALYELSAANAEAFVDITEGSTRCGYSVEHCCAGGFAAARGWDAMSGLGMPLFPALLSHLGPQQLLAKRLRAR